MNASENIGKPTPRVAKPTLEICETRVKHCKPTWNKRIPSLLLLDLRCRWYTRLLDCLQDVCRVGCANKEHVMQHVK